ncbi:MAG: DUF2202 domain-containing protein [Deltaproteobacteria bacterium]|nr:DUF2202 domain-containing protein [Deltaproteobacteria bacterium]
MFGRKSYLVFLVAMMCGLVALPAWAAGPGNPGPPAGVGGGWADAPHLNLNFTGAALSATDQASLLYVVQEEKLARDVYQFLGAAWNLPIFENIAAAEQQHMDAVGSLLEYNGLTDPTDSLAVGEFDDPTLQGLYGQLTSQGQASYTDALWVGATIEDLDIFDLTARMGESTNEDLLRVFSNLEEGSENHLRAFAGQLENYGADYTAQYISQAQLEEILASPWNAGPNW